MRTILPFAAALALFALLWASFRFSPWGLVWALASASLVWAGVSRWQQGMLFRGPSWAALERLAMKEAWRRGGVVYPKDLAPFLPEAEARELLEGLVQRGLCRREGEGYRF
jgi:hypothetical protein